MRILFLAHRIPFPPDKGDKIRSFHWLSALSAHHDVALVTFYDDPADHRQLGELEKICAESVAIRLRPWRSRFETLRAAISGRSLSVGHFHRKEAGAVVDDIIKRRQVDCVFAYSAVMAQYQTSSAVPRIMDLVDVDSAKFEAYGRMMRSPKGAIYALESRRLRRFESQIAAEWDAVLVSTDAERELFRSRTEFGRIETVCNGTFIPDDPNLEPRAAHRMIFIGAMDYEANVDAVRFAATEVLPLIRLRHPEVEYHIIGRQPAPAVRDLAKIDGVVVHGGVPDLRVFLDEARLALCPLRIAQGIQNKILESMAYGVPCVTTHRVKATFGQEGENCMRSGDSPKDLADRCSELFESDRLARETAHNARRFVESRFDWESKHARLLGIVEDVVKRRGAPRT